MPVSPITRKTIETAIAGLDADQAKVCAFIRSGKGNGKNVAAAGSGKTHTNVIAVAAMIALDSVNPASIALTTFTRKAGEELKTRLTGLLGTGGYQGLSVGTFHSLALRGLRKDNPRRWDMRRCMDVDGREKGIPKTDYLWKDILTWAPKGVPGTGAKGLGIELGYGQSTRDYGLQADLIRSTGVKFGTREADRLASESPLDFFADAWVMYEDAKQALNCWDFADALDGLHDLLLDGGGPRFGRVMVDEAQDNSFVQVEIARLMARNGGRLFVTGDGRQSIYEWRGASPETFLAIGTEGHEIEAKTLYLPNNYRSGGAIVALGNAIADGAAWALGPAANGVRSDTGSVVVKPAATSEEEADMVAHEIRAAMNQKIAVADDYAILCRTNQVAALFETALMDQKVPVTRLGATPFFERAAAKDFMAWLLLGEGDNLEALKRVYNKPKRYLGRAFLSALEARAGKGLSLVKVIHEVAPMQRGGSRDGARGLANEISRIRRLDWAGRVEAVRLLLTKQAAPDEKTLDGGQNDAKDMISVCAAIAERFSGAVEFCLYADECTKNTRRSNDNLKGRVTISTVHRAKGLEWKHVYVSATANTFPHSRSEGDDRRMAEERRLFYVAVTRAEDAVTITYSDWDHKGKVAGPSMFITDYVDTDVEEANG
jgi:DNA helicase-2/ATP-dependent DNA helicase PcrA